MGRDRHAMRCGVGGLWLGFSFLRLYLHTVEQLYSTLPVYSLYSTVPLSPLALGRNIYCYIPVV